MLGCPYEGEVSFDTVEMIAEKLFERGCYEVSLGDTIGHGTPDTVAAMLDAVLAHCPADRLAGHYHDTRGHALDNIEVSLTRGLRHRDFDRLVEFVAISNDSTLRHALWNEGWERYYPGGPDDPDHTVLCLRPKRAIGWYKAARFEFELGGA